MELFEQIRQEYKHGAGTIRAVAKRSGVQRRMVRQALASALPPERKRPERERPKPGPLKEFVDGVLEADRALKHGYLHACQHRPARRDASGQKELVPNHGLAAATMILLLAFTLSWAFVLRHLKLARLDGLTARAVAAPLHAGVSKAPPAIRAPA